MTYTALLAIGVIISLIYVAVGYRLHYARPLGTVVDVGLAGFIGGLIVARGFHVALNWAYFQHHTREITTLSAGGLNWHGAVIGALLAAGLVIRLWRRDLRSTVLLGLAAPALPLIGLMAWWGCAVAHCAYGAEVPNLAHYPDFLVWEARDIFNIIAPRYAVQPLGMGLCAALLVVALLRRDFWLSLLLLAAGMFLLGFLRGDYAVMLRGLRFDQWLDVLLFGIGLVGVTMDGLYYSRSQVSHDRRQQ